MKISCDSCYYSDECDKSDILGNRIYIDICADYAPLGEEAEETLVDMFIEEQRRQFKNEWFEYIEQEAEYFFD